MFRKLSRILFAPFNLELQVKLLYRISRVCIRIPMCGWFLARVVRYFMRVISGCDISPKAVIADSVRFLHPNGVVIGADVVIRDDVWIWQQVTIGSHGRKDRDKAYPLIDKGVRIYAKASIIGGVHVGENSAVGAHSLVIQDVPSERTVAGIPAKVVNEQVDLGGRR